MPQFSVSKTLIVLKPKFPDLKIVIASAYSNPEYVHSLIKGGIDGYWLKSEDPAQLIEAIHDVVQGKAWFSSDIMAIWAGHRQSRIPVDDLTPREIEDRKSVV